MTKSKVTMQQPKKSFIVEIKKSRRKQGDASIWAGVDIKNAMAEAKDDLPHEVAARLQDDSANPIR
jgi:hypothetical protein